jgi:hypothetical protein
MPDPVPPSSVWLPLAPPLLSAGVAAVLAALLSGYVVARWRAREDHVEKRYDEMCVTAQTIADFGSEYWAGTPTDEGMNLREAKILGGLTKLAGLRVAIGSYISNSSVQEMEAAESTFLRAITGGDFGVHIENPTLNGCVHANTPQRSLLFAFVGHVLLIFAASEGVSET